MTMKLHKTYLLLLLLAPVVAAATTTFTYQGQLNDGTEPFEGTVDMEFRLFDAGSGGNQIDNTISGPVEVSGGLFQVELDFGNQAYESFVWLEITVDGEVLEPRQRITAVPLAIRSLEGGSPWSVEPAGISFQGQRVAIGQSTTVGPQQLSVRSGSGQDPLSVINNDGLRALHVHEDTGVTIGGFFLAPPAGLMVHGNVQQERASYGFAKAAAVVECGEQVGAPGSIVRSFNNIPTASPPGQVTYLESFDSPGNCRLEFGVDLTDSFVVGTAQSLSGRNVECSVVTTTRVRCRIRDLSGNQVSARISLVVF